MIMSASQYWHVPNVSLSYVPVREFLDIVPIDCSDSPANPPQIDCPKLQSVSERIAAKYLQKCSTERSLRIDKTWRLFDTMRHINTKFSHFYSTNAHFSHVTLHTVK